MSEKVDVFMACKLMPFYRLGIFQHLSSISKEYRFYFFGDTKEQGSIKQIPFTYASAEKGEYIRWVKTKNYFYKPERLLWQTGIIKEIFRSKFKVFVFEGAIAHFPIWLYAFICKLMGKKVLYWTHGNRGKDKGIKKFLRVLLFKYLGDGLLLYGHYQEDNMIKDGYDPNRLFVIYNSLQPEKQFKVLDSLNIAKVNLEKERIFKYPENFTLIFIGRLVKHKGVASIVLAVKKLIQTGIPVNCIFIGKGEELESLKASVETLDLKDNIHFAGELYEEEEIAAYFAMSDLMISPGNVGLNCIHSLAYGVPVITHNNMDYQNPEVESIREGETGTLYEYDNFNDLINKLKFWINNHKNKAENKKACQLIIKNVYNPINQSNCIISSINKILNER